MRHVMRECPRLQDRMGYWAPEEAERMLRMLRMGCDECVPYDEYLMVAREFTTRAKLDWMNLVAQFHEKMGITMGFFPEFRDVELRKELIKEEMTETIEAIEKGDLPGAIDGIADSIYVLLGTAVAFGVNMHTIFRAVHEANMKKADGPKSESGKQLKPDGWEPPDIKGLLREQGWKG